MLAHNERGETIKSSEKRERELCRDAKQRDEKLLAEFREKDFELGTTMDGDTISIDYEKLEQFLLQALHNNDREWEETLLSQKQEMKKVIEEAFEVILRVVGNEWSEQERFGCVQRKKTNTLSALELE